MSDHSIKKADTRPKQNENHCIGSFHR